MTIRHMQHIALAAVMTICLWGCGSSSDKAPALNAAGEHPSDWYTAHRQAYSKAYLLDSALQCRDCHGIDLLGGIARVDCFTGIPGGSCHAGGHGPRAIPHAIPFTSPAAHGPAAKADLVYCQVCHGQSGGAGSNPRFNVAIGSLTQGCTASGCHNTNSPTQFRYTSAAHPIPWSGHNTAGNLLNACGLCHGANLLGGVGQSCGSTGCHASMTAGVPPVQGQCVSCHARPPASGAHAAHNAAAGLANLCSACHSGAGSGTALHNNGAVNVAFGSSYSAKTGTAVLNPDTTCANVSCHGGVATPAWTTGTIDASSQCTLCHTAGTASQSPQYNSYWSGEHARHVNSIGVPCSDCHDMTITSSGNSHFSNMATPAFELSPGLTIRTQVNYAGGSCSPGVTPPPGAFQFTNCHATESW